MGRPALVQQSLARLLSSKRPREQIEHIDLGMGSWLLYSPSLLEAGEADDLARDLLRELPWERREVVVHGRRVLQPRLVTYQADDPSLSYTYSRVQIQPEPWHPLVLQIKVWGGVCSRVGDGWGQGCRREGEDRPLLPVQTHALGPMH